MFARISPDAPTINPSQIAALYRMSNGPARFQVIAGCPREVVVQDEDGRAWVLSAIGSPQECDALTSPYDATPLARHPKMDFGCPEEGCTVRMPMLADGALLGSVVAEFHASHGASAREIVSEEALTCPVHGTDLENVER